MFSGLTIKIVVVFSGSTSAIVVFSGTTIEQFFLGINIGTCCILGNFPCCIAQCECRCGLNETRRCDILCSLQATASLFRTPHTGRARLVPLNAAGSLRAQGDTSPSIHVLVSRARERNKSLRHPVLFSSDSFSLPDTAHGTSPPGVQGSTDRSLQTTDGTAFATRATRPEGRIRTPALSAPRRESLLVRHLSTLRAVLPLGSQTTVRDALTTVSISLSSCIGFAV